MCQNVGTGEGRAGNGLKITHTFCEYHQLMPEIWLVFSIPEHYFSNVYHIRVCQLYCKDYILPHING